MQVLTWHGTILRLETAQPVLTHVPLVPVRALSKDFGIEIPPGGLAQPLMGPNNILLLPGVGPGTVRFWRESGFLCIEPSVPRPMFSRAAAGPWELFLLAPWEAVAVLRTLLSFAWTGPDGERIARSEIRLEEGFVLRVGSWRMDLQTGFPAAVEGADDRIALTAEAGGAVLTKIPGTDHGPEVYLRPKPVEAVGAVNEMVFMETPDCRLTLTGPEEFCAPPLTVAMSDRDWMRERHWHGFPVDVGVRRFASHVVRERNKYVLLCRGAEGIVFDESGISNEAGYLVGMRGKLPHGMSHEAEATIVEEALLDGAPFFTGSFAMFYGGNLSNYFHWVIDAMVPLTLMAPYLPAEAKLLLPGTLARLREDKVGKFDHLQVLEAFGFGDMPCLTVEEDLCQVGEVYWAGQCFIGDISAELLRATRERALARRAAPARSGRKIYIKRAGSRSVVNALEVESELSRLGFESFFMEELDVYEQIDLFRGAAFVVGAHGAALANLIFCPAGTKVLEMSPDEEYRPFFAQIAYKLGLAHAVLPCPTDDNTFFGRLTVPMDRFSRLLRLLQSRL
jgi:capsular polysaccharide biosynthesis protein